MKCLPVTSYDQVLSEMLQIVKDRSAVINASMDFLTDYSQVKNCLSVELIGQDQNWEQLTQIPHFDMEDLSVVYRIILGNYADSQASVLVTNQMMERYGVTPEQLHRDAMENAPKNSRL